MLQQVQISRVSIPLEILIRNIKASKLVKVKLYNALMIKPKRRRFKILYRPCNPFGLKYSYIKWILNFAYFEVCSETASTRRTPRTCWTTFVNEHQYIQLCKWMQSRRFREPPPGFEFIKGTIGREIRKFYVPVVYSRLTELYVEPFSE